MVVGGWTGHRWAGLLPFGARQHFVYTGDYLAGAIDRSLAFFDLLQQALPLLFSAFDQLNGKIEMLHVICIAHGVATFAHKRTMRTLVA